MAPSALMTTPLSTLCTGACSAWSSCLGWYPTVLRYTFSSVPSKWEMKLQRTWLTWQCQIYFSSLLCHFGFFTLQHGIGHLEIDQSPNLDRAEQLSWFLPLKALFSPPLGTFGLETVVLLAALINCPKNNLSRVWESFPGGHELHNVLQYQLSQ